MNPDPEIYEVSFPVLISQTNTLGILTVAGLADMMQEAAARHAEKLGWGFKAMQENRRAWFLRNLHIRYTRPVTWKEELTVKTWPLPPERLLFQREYMVYDHNKKVVAEGSSGWMLINLDKMRPVDKIPDGFGTLHFCQDRLFSDAFPKIPGINNTVNKVPFVVHYRDLDLNGHVNHVNYIRWVMDVFHRFSITLRFPVSIHLKFQQAMMKGEEGIAIADTETGSGAYLFQIVRPEDQTEIVRASLRKG